VAVAQRELHQLLAALETLQALPHPKEIMAVVLPHLVTNQGRVVVAVRVQSVAMAYYLLAVLAVLVAHRQFLALALPMRAVAGAGAQRAVLAALVSVVLAVAQAQTEVPLQPT
jgi:hypothetical protein